MDPKESAYGLLVKAARADGDVRPEEQKVLNAYLVRLGLDPSRARDLEAGGGDPGKATPDVLRAVLEVAAADGTVSPRELELVRSLAGRRPVEALVAAALSGSRRALDKAFARRDVEAMEDAGGDQRSGELLRSLPFIARLAPATRSCQVCLKPFAARDRYEQYCRICRRDIVDPRNSGRRGEWMFLLLFIGLAVPAAYLVERLTGLWSWGYALIEASPRRPTRGERIDTGPSVYIMPAAILTLLVTAALAWAGGALFMRQVRAKR